MIVIVTIDCLFTLHTMCFCMFNQLNGLYNEFVAVKTC